MVRSELMSDPFRGAAMASPTSLAAAGPLQRNRLVAVDNLGVLHGQSRHRELVAVELHRTPSATRRIHQELGTHIRQFGVATIK